ncbi:MAG TPA: NBR1-Ig-like domain-containing protein [Anaerolineales bacterium]|nr:NBR1-Ig-like domain-containing protein [Anaerolineales bacterium]
MRSRLKFASILLLFALMLSLIPAATIVQPAAAWSSCDWAQFVADVTVPDGTTYAPGASFRKTWRLKNIGSCAWTTSYALVFDSGERFGAPAAVNFPITVNPGQTVDISVDMTAPSTAGQYYGYWKLRNASNVVFGIGSTASSSFWVEINVNTSAGTGYDFTANAASAAWASGAGALSFPGTDGSSSGFALSQSNPHFESGVTSAQPGLLFAPNNIVNGYIQATYPVFHVLSGDRFQATIGCDYGATNCYVAYQLQYQIGSGPIYTFWTFREKYDGLTYNVDLNLSSLANQDVKFILSVSAYGSPVGDRALWGNPIISRAGVTPPPVTVTPYPTGGYNYDFGTSSSALASGYNRVTETTAYTSGGFGWTDTSTLESRDRTSSSDPLRRDFVMSSSAARTFRVDLPNGSYLVTVTMGDNDYAHDNMIVKANGVTVLSNVSSAAGSFAVNSFNVTISSGSLSLEFSDGGGSDPTWVVNALTISPTTPPTSGCDRAQFITDVTIPDGTPLAPGIAFSKTWRLKNIGTCTWTTGYALIFDSGEKMGGPDSAALPTNVAPGQTVDITVQLTSPTTAGTYRGYWKFRNANGVPFGIGAAANKSWWVEIRVTGTGIVPATSTPLTPVTPATPIAGTSFDFATNACNAAWYSAAGQLPCPGTDGDQRGFVLKQSNPHREDGATVAQPGLLTFPQNVFNGYIQGIYPPYLVKAGDRFRSVVNCEYGATSCYVVFRLDYQIGNGGIQTFWAFVEKTDGLFYQADLDLSPLVGQNVKFILTVLSTGSPTGDRALWISPIIYNGSAVPTVAPATSTPLPLTATPTLTSTPQPPTATPTMTNTPMPPTDTATATP